MRIYIAGPLSAPTVREEFENVERALEVAGQLAQLGHHVEVPHLTQYLAQHPAWQWAPRTYEFWVGWWDIPLLRECDAIFLMDGWGHSTGCRMELAFAYKEGIDTYFHLEDVPDNSSDPEFQRALGNI